MRSILLAAFALLAVAGCREPAPLPLTDAAKGRELLKTTLETWKRGGTVEDLKAGSPSITARDPDWAAGAKLVGYEMSPEDKYMGTDLLVGVKLTLSSPDGKQQDKRVGFTVGTGPQTIVFRNE